ncbi:MAG TPA: YetF domain-containing protein, partial [Bacteroidia bacterium]|nr:YetF domain-containing protein [Bacteroidia bacterium]
MMENFTDILLRASVVYLFMVAAIRLFGKKELSQLSVTDLVFILLISNAVQNAMLGPDTSLAGGVLAALCLFVLNYLLKLIMYRSKKVKSLIEGEPVMLVYKGNLIEDNMAKEKITLDELEAVVREHGVSSIDNVALAILEIDGNISVLSKEIEHQSFHKPQRKELHP